MPLADIGKIILSLFGITAMLAAGMGIPWFFWDREPIKAKMVGLTCH